MPFNETAVFPGCPKFGFQSSPLWATDITETAGGEEFRNVNWESHLRSVTVTVGPGPGGEEEVEEVWDFYNAHSGEGYGFRVKDYADWKSCHTRDTPTMLDQPLVLISGNVYQLAKRYAAGALFTEKWIYKPFSDEDFGDIQIADGGVLQTEGGDYTLNTATGEVTFSSPPSGAVTWGGCYHIPCRFSGEFPVEIVNFRAKSVSFRLRELRYEDL